ncbi:VTT domain-containing protein [uncultured Cohaesibacter sp.]|uniref:TVP38/TMEM64 family protein n=1 Tax=uncultured Cohaesibacter sp. TaxID=1002546 RepID=UPI00292FDAEA|nr:VTT domain-containing protein [uncultured Cohaesibacter sp.]
MTERLQLNNDGKLAMVRPYLKGMIMIMTLVAIGYSLKALGISEMFDEHWVDAEVKGQGSFGYLLFVAMGGLLAAVGFPRQAISFMGGYAFGMVGGTALSVLATTCGCVLSFTYARILGREFVQRNFGRRVARFENILADSPFVTTLLIRFLPVGSNVATNLVAGVTHVGAFPFFLGSAVGYLPQTAIFALMGSGVQVDQTSQIGVGITLFVISGLLGVYLYRRINKAKAMPHGDDSDVEQSER